MGGLSFHVHTFPHSSLASRNPVPKSGVYHYNSIKRYQVQVELVLRRGIRVRAANDIASLPRINRVEWSSFN